MVPSDRRHRGIYGRCFELKMEAVRKNDRAGFLRAEAVSAFEAALRAADAEAAIVRSVRFAESGNVLEIENVEIPIPARTEVYSIAFGKAATAMAKGLNRSLGNRLKRGIVSGPINGNAELPANWSVFHGGHPEPNEDSLLAAEAAFRMLGEADKRNSIFIFLVSGGGSAMLDLPKNEGMTLADLRSVNQILVTCGATIGEVNSVRRLISRIKGGGLSKAAGSARQVSLIVSDTNQDEAFDVASGPTILTHPPSRTEIRRIMDRYDLKERLPRAALEFIEDELQKDPENAEAQPRFFVLLDNETVIRAADEYLQRCGFVTEVAALGVVEAEIEEGCRKLVEQLSDLRSRTLPERPVAIISGGEFICPVRGSGVGGRNSEAALRTSIHFDNLRQNEQYLQTAFLALFAGTDGIDGNSPAAGAIADDTTVRRAKAASLDPTVSLLQSDSFSFFLKLGDELTVGPTATNVRDLRVLLAF